ncbi:hypothetical protein BDW22DRAFT_1356253 [Trametopsis cervina]|nr:hypothetical protein BDW22DRAFT_1356253 [Trametopsis cervina]
MQILVVIRGVPEEIMTVHTSRSFTETDLLVYSVLTSNFSIQDQSVQNDGNNQVLLSSTSLGAERRWEVAAC